jgi:predicted enzyme related to lactoylglutathione lyase
LVALLVADLDAAVAELAGRGITGGPAVPQGDGARKVSFTDPDGNEISLIHVST